MRLLASANGGPRSRPPKSKLEPKDKGEIRDFVGDDLRSETRNAVRGVGCVL